MSEITNKENEEGDSDNIIIELKVCYVGTLHKPQYFCHTGCQLFYSRKQILHSAQHLNVIVLIMKEDIDLTIEEKWRKQETRLVLWLQLKRN